MACQSDFLSRCTESLQLHSLIFILHWAREVTELTIYAGRPRPGGAGDLASPAGAAGCLPGDGPPGNTAVSVEHHYFAGSHRQLACQTQQ